jgi:hypothetical protein
MRRSGQAVTGDGWRDPRQPPGYAITATGPVIVLAAGYSGAETLTSILESRPGWACTSSTGILPLCAQAMTTWRKLGEGFEAMGTASVRSLASAMITCVLAAAGGKRWCEVSTAPAAAASFAMLFPRARFVCLYRACPSVIAAAADTSPGGLASGDTGDFAARHPGSNVAAIAAYWCAVTSAMLGFEAAHADRSLRIRFEDLAAATQATTDQLMRFLDLGTSELGLAAVPEPAGKAGVLVPGTGGVPVSILPEQLLARVNELHAALGYPAVGQRALAAVSHPAR